MALYWASPQCHIVTDRHLEYAFSQCPLQAFPDIHIQFPLGIISGHEVTEYPDAGSEFPFQQTDDIVYFLNSFHCEIVPVCRL